MQNNYKRRQTERRARLFRHARRHILKNMFAYRQTFYFEVGITCRIVDLVIEWSRLLECDPWAKPGPNSEEPHHN